MNATHALRARPVRTLAAVGLALALSAAAVLALPRAEPPRHAPVATTHLDGLRVAAASGDATKGSWASINMTATGNTRSVINADGTTAAHANTYGGMGAFGPAGMRQFPDGTGSTYFATYNTKLFTIVGASNVTTGGYLQLNLLD